MLELSTANNNKWIYENGNRKVILTSELAKHIENDLKYYFVKNDSNDKPFVYIYWDGVYRNVSENEFKAIIKQYIPYNLVKMRDVNEVYSNIQADFRHINHEALNSNEDIINFKDGILNIKTMEFSKHTPDILSTIQIPINYKDVENSDGIAPVFEKYMMHLVDNNFDKYEILMEYFGLSISNIYGYRTKKALFLVGEGNTGKSQIKRLIECILGSENISTIDLKSLNERNGTSSIYQKRLAGCNDMSYQKVTDMSIFKSLTGGDKVSFEFKYKSIFSSIYNGVLWFNCNELPLFGGDKGDWVYERMLPIYCGKPVSPEERDPKLFEKMWKEKEAIVKLALISLQNLISNNFKFNIPEDTEEKLEAYKTRNNTLLLFIEECCIVNIEGRIIGRTRKSDFKKIYYRWCDVNNNGKGKLKLKEMDELLKRKYKETYIVSNGYTLLNNIKVIPSEAKDLGMYLESEEKDK